MCYANMISDKLVNARKPHRCWGCLDDIAPGEKYLRIVQKDHDGELRQINWCGPCQDVITDWGDVCYEEGCVAEHYSYEERRCKCGHDDEDDHSDDDGKASGCTVKGCTCQAFAAAFERPKR